jgi:hypothetical protein
LELGKANHNQRTAEWVLQAPGTSWIYHNSWTLNLPALPTPAVPELSKTAAPLGEYDTSTGLERTTQSRAAGGQIALSHTQNWWSDKWSKYFFLPGWGGMEC